MKLQLTISSVDHAPGDLYEQIPIIADLLRQIPGDDRQDYWIGRLEAPVRWLDDNIHKQITHVVLAARWVGTAIAPGVENLPVGIAYVTDSSLLEDNKLDCSKCRYVAIGLSTETSGGRGLRPPGSILAGHIARAFGTGKPSGHQKSTHNQ